MKPAEKPVEQKPEQSVDIKTITTEKLALALNQQYLGIRQNEQMILMINAELQRREQEQK
jgi:hypothetical protein